MVFHAYHYLGEKSVAPKGRLSIWVHQRKPIPSLEKKLSNQLLQLTIQPSYNCFPDARSFLDQNIHHLKWED